MYSLRQLVLTTCIAAFMVVQYSAGETIKCYVCTTEGGNKDCGVPFKKPEETEADANSTSGAGDEITILEDCKHCITTKVTNGDDVVYTRACTLIDVDNICVSVLDISTCTSTCDTDLCNVGDDASALRCAFLSILSTLLLSLLTKY